MAKVPVIDADLCTGCELCVEICPGVFHIDEETAKVFDPEGASDNEIQDAIDNCPVEAINWE